MRIKSGLIPFEKFRRWVGGWVGRVGTVTSAKSLRRCLTRGGEAARGKGREGGPKTGSFLVHSKRTA